MGPPLFPVSISLFYEPTRIPGSLVDLTSVLEDFYPELSTEQEGIEIRDARGAEVA